MTAGPLLINIRACTLCAPDLASGPRPIVQLSATARIVIIGQAPGRRVHESGVPWDDASGDRLRDLTGLTLDVFYDPARVALLPMGFCYPGTGTSGDLPPRPEWAPLWHPRALAVVPGDALHLLVGSYAQARYLAEARKTPLTARVAAFAAFGPGRLPLSHPSWRSTECMKKNPWFGEKVLPALRAAVRMALDGFPAR